MRTAQTISDWMWPSPIDAGLAGCPAGPALPAAITELIAGARTAVEADHSQEADLDDVRRCQSGDGEAYRRIVERHQRRIALMMWRFSRDPQTHEELVQDVFVEAYLSLRTYRARAPFAHWLARIATRAGYRHWKRLARERERASIPIEEWNSAVETPPAEMTPKEAAQIVHGLLARLPPRDRLVLTLRYLEERTVEETARLAGWSQTMVKVQTWRARRKFKALFEEWEEESK